MSLLSVLAESTSLQAWSAIDPLSWLDKILFHTWPGKLFERDYFKNVTDTIAVGVSLIAAGLWLLERRAIRLGKDVDERASRKIGIFLTVFSFLLYFDFFNPNTRYVDYYHRHELYHYYLGSKYFEEVGYERLYTCTARAEVELGHGEAIKKRENTHKMAEANKAFAHYRW